jgi:predicted peroxiredoxin
MRLGFFVTEATHASTIIDLTRAAVKRGHEAVIFLTDDGVQLIRRRDIAELRNLEHVNMSLCNFSAQRRKIADSDIPDKVINGTQYQNSLMHNECDKIVML